MKQKKQRLLAMFGVAVVALIFAIILRATMVQTGRPEPSAPGYYTGPMRPKGGQEILATEDGKVLPLPDSMKSKKDTNPAAGSPSKDSGEKAVPGKTGE